MSRANPLRIESMSGGERRGCPFGLSWAARLDRSAAACCNAPNVEKVGLEGTFQPDSFYNYLPIIIFLTANLMAMRAPRTHLLFIGTSRRRILQIRMLDAWFPRRNGMIGRLMTMVVTTMIAKVYR
jgi:hypothetical protein